MAVTVFARAPVVAKTASVKAAVPKAAAPVVRKAKCVLRPTRLETKSQHFDAFSSNVVPAARRVLEMSCGILLDDDSAVSAKDLLATHTVQQQLMAAVTVGTGAALMNPLVAEAAVTPSLSNLLKSVVAGGTLLAIICGAVVTVSQFDPVNRK